MNWVNLVLPWNEDSYLYLLTSSNAKAHDSDGLNQSTSARGEYSGIRNQSMHHFKPLKTTFQDVNAAKYDGGPDDWIGKQNIDWFDQSGLRTWNPGYSKKILIWGDSHANQLWPKFIRNPKPSYTVMFYTVCPPIPIFSVKDAWWKHCVDKTANNHFVANVLPVLNLTDIVISAFFEKYLKSEFGWKDSVTGEQVNIDLDTPFEKTFFFHWQRYLKLAIQSKARVFVSLPYPTGLQFSPFHMVERHTRKISIQRSVDMREYRNSRYVAPVIKMLKILASRLPVLLLDPCLFWCVDGSCPTLNDDDKPIFSDDNHMRPLFFYTRNWGKYLDSVLIDAIEETPSSVSPTTSVQRK
jgi:hypothetical protein